MEHWLSPAKLNLFLYITGRRSDNYHNLQTLFQFIDYCDTLTFNLRSDGQVNLVTPFKNIAYSDNLIVIAAKKLQSYANNPKLGVDIAIDKKIPMGGGLGGASSNAATVLIALNTLWQLNLSTDVLIDLGRKIGADVPIFIYGHAAFAEGIGDQFQPIAVNEYWYLVSCPSVEISTATIFNDPNLTRDTVKKSCEQLLAQPFSEFKNDCEQIVRKRYPQVDNIISHLSKYAPTRLTGTGSCVFTQCESKAQAEEIQKTLVNLPVKHFIAKAANRSPCYSIAPVASDNAENMPQYPALVSTS